MICHHCSRFLESFHFDSGIAEVIVVSPGKSKSCTFLNLVFLLGTLTFPPSTCAFDFQQTGKLPVCK